MSLKRFSLKNISLKLQKKKQKGGYELKKVFGG